MELSAHFKNVIFNQTLDDVRRVQLPVQLHRLINETQDQTWRFWKCPDGESRLSWRRFKACFTGNGTCSFLTCPRSLKKRSLPISQQLPDATTRDAIELVNPELNERVMLYKRVGPELPKFLHLQNYSYPINIGWNAFTISMTIATLTLSIIAIGTLNAMVLH
jgi:hypothetical protein